MADLQATVPLGSLIEIQRGSTYKSALLGQDGPVLLGLSTIARNGGFRSDSLRTYGGDSPERMLVPPGGMYASLKDVTQSADLLGSVARLPPQVKAGRLTQDTVRLDLVSDAIDPDFLYWQLLTPQYRDYCRAHATGTTNLGLPRDDFLAYPVWLPPLDVQRRIAGVLGNLDDLIDTNRRLAIQCEALALSIVEQVPPTTALDQIAVLATKAEKPEGLVDHYSIPAFDGNRLPSREQGVAIKSNKITLLEPAVLISRLNPATSRVWMAFPEPDAVSMCSTEFAVLKCANPEFVWAACSTTRFNEELVAMATGTTGSRQRVDKSDVMRLAVPNPRQTEKPVLHACTSLVKQAYACRLEAHQIGQARDELLPLLMSGQVVPGEVA